MIHGVLEQQTSNTFKESDGNEYICSFRSNTSAIPRLFKKCVAVVDDIIR